MFITRDTAVPWAEDTALPCGTFGVTLWKKAGLPCGDYRLAVRSIVGKSFRSKLSQSARKVVLANNTEFRSSDFSR